MAKSLHVAEVVKALEELGGDASWPSIEQRVTQSRSDSYAPYQDWNNFKKTMFQLVQQHCVGYAKFTGPVLFKKTPHGFSLAGTDASTANRVRVPSELVHPETVPSNRECLTGAVREVLVNAYERDPKARRECLEKYGTSCAVCKISFEQVYGDIGRGFIHVHHKRQLSSREVYRLNPTVDLVPVCPNCHSMLHTSDPPLDVDELIELIRQTACEQG